MLNDVNYDHIARQLEVKSFSSQTKVILKAVGMQHYHDNKQSLSTCTYDELSANANRVPNLSKLYLEVSVIGKARIIRRDRYIHALSAILTAS